MTSQNCRPWLLLCFFALLTGPQAAWAAVQVKSGIQTTEWTVGDQNLIQIQVEGADRSASIQLPDVPGLTLQQTGPPAQSSQTFWVNGTKTSHNSLTFQISVLADKPGLFTIRPIQILYQGKTYQTEVYQVQAVKGLDSKLMALIVRTDKKQVYLGERLEIELVWQLHQSIEDYKFRFPLLAQKDELKLRLKPYPAKTVTKDLSIDAFRVAFSPSQLADGGTQYATTFEITPQKLGDLKIPAGHIKGMIAKGYQQQRDFFGRVVRQPKLVPIYTSSLAQIIPVVALPEQGRPADFTGAVGQFELEVETQGRGFEVGEPVVLTLKITGKGNLDKIERPTLSELAGGFDVDETLSPGEVKDGLVLFQQTVRAKQPGVQEIGPVSFPYFDPVEGLYKRVTAPGIPVEILPARRLQFADIAGAKAAQKSDTAEPTTLATTYNLLSAAPPQTELPSWVWLVGLVGITLGFVGLENRKPKATTTLPDLPPFGLDTLEPLGSLGQEAGLREVIRLTTTLLDWKFGPQRRWSGGPLKQLVSQGFLDKKLGEQIEHLLRETETSLYAGSSQEAGLLAPALAALQTIYQELTAPPRLADAG